MRTLNLLFPILTLALALPVVPVCAQEDDDLTVEASAYPGWANGVVKSINAGQPEAALGQLDKLAPKYGKQFAYHHLRGLAWVAIYESTPDDDEKREIQAMQQARASLRQALTVAPASQRATISEVVQGLESELKDRGASLTASRAAAPRPAAVPRPQPKPVAQAPAAVESDVAVEVLPAGGMPFAPEPSNTPKLAANGDPKPTVTGTEFPERHRLRLPALKPRPGYIIGRAYHESGRPLPRFFVDYSGFQDGKVAPMFNGMAIETVKGKIQGSGGRFAIKVPPGAYRANAWVEIPYHGQNYRIDLWSKKVKYDYDGLGLVKLRGGIVKDFIWKMTDYKREGTGANSTETTFRWAYNGGVITLDGGTWEYIGGKNTETVTSKYPKDAVVELVLKPGDKLIDGTPAKTMVYRLRVDALHLWTSFIRRVPIGYYTATARVYIPGGGVENLKVALEGTSYNSQTKEYRVPWKSSVPVLFKAHTGVLRGVEDLKIYLGPGS